MAHTVAVDTWDGTGVRLGQVAEALADLRNQSSDRSATRTAVMTLVAVALTDEQAYAATGALHALGAHHPARILVLRPDPDQVATLDARAVLYAAEAEGHQVNFEEITLLVSGQAAHHLDSVIETFTLPDLPIVVWYVGSIPELADPLLSVAHAVIIDSRDTAGATQLRLVAELASSRTVVDLSWIRLRPWRELLAGLFDPPAYRCYLDVVDNAEVKGKPGPRHLLGGWLLGQLGLNPAQVTLTDARHVSLTLSSHRDQGTGTFDVGRLDGRRLVWAGATVSNGPSLRQMLPLADDPLSWSLGEALTHLQPDRVWERALSSALVLAP